MKRQIFDALNYFLREDGNGKLLREHLRGLWRFYQFCVEEQVEDIEQMAFDQVRKYREQAMEAGQPKAAGILEQCRKVLFLQAKDIHWDADVWYLERLSLQPERIDPSSPVVSLSFVEVTHHRNRQLLKKYMKYGLGLTDLSLRYLQAEMIDIRNFLKEIPQDAWKMLLSCLELFAIGMNGICICVSGTFSGEYQSGADSIILSSRYGKSKLLTAKILAAFAYSFFLFTLFLLVGCGILLAGFGTDGWELPVQVLNTILPYDLSLAGAAVTAVGTLYLILAGMVSFTLLLSAKMRTAVPVLVIIVFAFMLPMFIGISETNGIWNRIFVLLPYRAAQPVFSDDFYGYFGYPIGGLTFDVVTVRMLLYAAVTLICVPFARKAWKGHQVV